LENTPLPPRRGKISADASLEIKCEKGEEKKKQKQMIGRGSELWQNICI
jgi:hypothetical protein